MKKNWQHKERAGARRIEGDLKQLRLPFRKRVDLVWLVLFSTAFFVFILWWLIGVLLGHRFGLFDPPAVRAIEDPRILINFQDDIDQYPLLDAAYHAPEESLILSQKGGNIHLYSPNTGLWKTEKPFSSGLTLLRSGCGSDPSSYGSASCWDTDSLWGLTENNGLVRRSQNKWQIVVGDSLFMGSRGQPVNQGELTGAAVSKDKNWLVVGTNNDGAGIYDLKNRQWLKVDKEVMDGLPSQQVSHVIWSLDRFWLGGPKGLASLKLVNGQAHMMAHKSVTGRILDMDADLEGNPWVLERRNCQSGGNKCLRLSRFRILQETKESPETLVMDLLMEERNIFPMLNLEDLHFARYWPAFHRLIAAGTAGLYSYDTNLHNWERHYRGAVQAVLPLEDGNPGFYFGFTGGIGIVSERYQPWLGSSKKCTTWKLPGQNQNEKIMSLHFGPNDEVLALGMSGKVFSLDIARVNDNIATVFKGKRTGVNPNSFQKAVSFGDLVLFQAAKKAVVHHYKKRSYTDIPLEQLPNWLKQPGLQMKTSGDWVYASSVKGGETWVYRLNLKDAEAGDFQKAPSLAVIPGPVREFKNWNGQGVALITGPGDGRVFHFESGKEELIGSRVPGSQKANLLDAAYFQGGMAIATPDGLLHYDYRTRSWSNYIRVSGGSSPRELAGTGDRLFMSTSNGRLLELDHSRKFTGLVGGDERFNMTDGQLSDVLVIRDKLYLAGNGWVYRYDPLLRSITVPWKVPGQGRLRLHGIIDNLPLTTRGGMAYLGSDALDVSAGRVLNISVNDAYIYTLRQKNNNDIYLKRYDKDDPFSRASRCFFSTAYSGYGTGEVTDAVELANDVIALATSSGLKLYNPMYRSWVQHIEPDPLPRGGRIYKMGNEVVFAGESGSGIQLSIMYIDSLRMPSSCGNAPVTILQKPRKVKAYAVKQSKDELYVIEPDNAVALWHGSNRFEYMPATDYAPLTADLERVYLRETAENKFLSFVPSGYRYILRYDLVKRLWHTLSLDLSALSRGQVLEDINCESSGFQEWITLKTSGREFYSGSVDLLTPKAIIPQNGIKMDRVFSPGDGFSHPGNSILDVQQGGPDRWTFLLKDRVKYYDPQNRRWSGDIMIPDLTGTPVIYGWKNRTVVRSSGSNAWWVGRQEGKHPQSLVRYQPLTGETTALDEEGAIWRLMPGGMLYRIEMPDSGNAYPASALTVETPYIIEPGQVRSAYEWDHRIVFETAKGYRILDSLLRRELEIPEAIEDERGIKEILTFGNQLFIRTTRDRLLLITYQTGQEAGLTARVFPGRISNLEQRVVELRGEEFDNSPVLKDQWQELKRRVTALPDGRLAFNPVIALEVNSKGQLTARRAESSTALASTGVMKLDSIPQALDEGWLRWDRKGRGFRIKTAESELSEMFISADGFVQDGKLLFENVEALLIIGPNNWYAANEHGIWHCTGGGLKLNQRNNRFTALNWKGSISAVHGGFIAGGQRFDLDEKGKFTPSNTLNYTASFGDVRVLEDMQQRRVSGHIKGNLPLFARNGFTWDQNRRGLGFIGDKLVILSDAGVHPVESYVGFEAPPQGTGQVDGTLYNRVERKEGNSIDEELYFQRGNRWYKRTGPSQWRSTNNPVSTRNLIDNNTWTWNLKNGQLDVRLASDNFNFKIQRSSRGLAFNSDLVKTAAVVDGQLTVVSQAFSERTGSGDRYQVGYAFNAGRSKSNDLRMEQQNVNNGQQKIYYPENANDRSAVLRFTRLNAASGGGTVRKELRVQNLSGDPKWMSFDFLYGRFPFDVITSLAAIEGGELYVGSGGGLQIYSSPYNLSLSNMEPCIQLATNAANGLTPVDTVGVPVNDKTVMRVSGSGWCIQKKHTETSFRRCNQRSGFTRWRHGGHRGLRDQKGISGTNLSTNGGNRQDVWQFVKKGSRLEYAYYDETGKRSTAHSDLMNGRFPHDNLKDIAVTKNGDVFTMWRNGWIARHKEGYLDFTQLDRHEYFNTRKMNAQGFIQLGENVYFEGDGERLWQFFTDQNNTGRWQEVQDRGAVRKILDRLKQPYIVNRPRLRMAERRPFYFEYRNLKGQWKKLKWTDSGLAIDEWSEFLYINGQLWAATGEGLVRFSRQWDQTGNAQQIILDPAQLIVCAEPMIKGKLLPVTDMEMSEGKIRLRLEGKSNQVFQGILRDTADDGIFENIQDIQGKDAEDPFYRRVQVSTTDDFWEWVTDGRTGQNPGHLKARWQGEEVQLVGGRFGFDTINSLAFFKSHRVEIATDSGGWIESDTDSIAVPRLIRPKMAGIDAANVKEVRTSRTAEGERVLGLRLAGRTFVRLGKEGVLGQTGAFPQLLADDGFWRYMKDDSGLVIAAGKSTGGGGRVTRKIEKGRFTDDIVMGLPVTVAWKNRNCYLLPTVAGVLELNRNLQAVDIYPSMKEKNVKDSGMLYVDQGDNEQVAFILERGVFRKLDKDQKDGVPLPSPNVPGGAEITGVENGPQDFIRVRWKNTVTQGWTLLNRKGKRVEELNSLYVDLSKFDKYVSNRKKWGETKPWMRVRLVDGQQVEFLLYGGNQPYVMHLPEATNVLAAIVNGQRLILAGAHKLWEINLEYPLAEWLK